MTAAEVAQHIQNAKQLPGGEWEGRCPCSEAHNHGDAKPSLRWRDKGDRILMSCKAGVGCKNADIMAELGLTLADLFHHPKEPGTTTTAPIVAEYVYQKLDGSPAHKTIRRADKTFSQRGCINGQWATSLDGANLVLYHLPDLQGVTWVVIPEGEKDVDNLRALGLPSTCNPMGAGKWRDEYAQQLIAAGVTAVVVIPDRDQPGCKHAHQVAHSCLTHGLQVKVLHLPGLDPKGDVSDWIAAGGRKADLLTLIKNTPRTTLKGADWTPPVIELVKVDENTWSLGPVDLDYVTGGLATPLELLKPGLLQVMTEMGNATGQDPDAIAACYARLLPYLGATAETPSLAQATALVPVGKHQSQADLLVGLIDDLGVELFVDASDGETAYATVTVGGRRKTWPVLSGGFKRWLRGQFYLQHKKAPGTQGLTDAISTIEARASADGAMHPVYTRVAQHNGKIYVDMADAEGNVIEIAPAGWDIIKDAPVRFRQDKGMLALPMPADEPHPDGFAAMLRQFINCTDETLPLIAGWCVMALHPPNNGDYPVLAINGEHSTAKSTLIKILQKLVDPAKAEGQHMPEGERELFIQANSSWVVSLDNLSGLPVWLSDVLCALSTGGAYRTRSLFTNDEETIFRVHRPVILGGIGAIVTRPDLLDRAILAQLPVIPDQQRKDKAVCEAEFEAAYPTLLASLLTAVCTSLANRDSVSLPSRKPRMVDFARRVEAAAPTFGWEPNYFMGLYMGMRDENHELALDADVLGVPVQKLVDKHGEWEGTATELFDALEGYADDRTRKGKDWPNSRTLRTRLQRLAPNFRATGIEIDSDRTGHAGTRTITIRRTPITGENIVSNVSIVSPPATPATSTPTTLLTTSPEFVSTSSAAKSPERKGADNADDADDLFPSNACDGCGPHPVTPRPDPDSMFARWQRRKGQVDPDDPANDLEETT